MGDAWAIVLGLATLAGGAWALVAFVSWIRKRQAKLLLPTYSGDELRKRLKILAIDDAGFTYLPDFQKDGYSIDHWTRVERLNDIENYDHDVLVLDIRGIASHISDDDGLGIAAHARRSMESLPIIIYSSAAYSLSVDTRCADYVFEVSGGDYRRFRDLIDEAFARLSSPEYYARHFSVSDQSGISPQDRSNLIEEIRTTLMDPALPHSARSYSTHETAARAAEIVRHAEAVARRLRRTDV